jgi:phytoene dehydrogenase-like protein
MSKSTLTAYYTFWDAVVVGAGHNGLTCAAYLAKEGHKFGIKRILVVEKNSVIGGACSLRTWNTKGGPLVISPCAYLAGLLHPLVIEELQLVKRGLKWTHAPGFFIPFQDGKSILLYEDSQLFEAEMKNFAPEDIEGWKRLLALIERAREILRPADPSKDVWVGPAPTRKMILERIKGDKEVENLLFNWSMAEFLDKYLTNEKLKLGLYGQGVIGTGASPFDEGTASVYFYHASGRMNGIPGGWGYIEKGMGYISHLIADAAKEYGVTILTNTEITEIIPGTGVVDSNGHLIRARFIFCNTDPRTATNLLGNRVPLEWLNKVVSIPIRGYTAKMNLALKELPNFKSRPGLDCVHHRGQIEIPLESREQWRECWERAQKGLMPRKVWCECYIQTAVDKSVSPSGLHHMSIFTQYFPYEFSEGDWDSRRNEAIEVVLNSLRPYCSNLDTALVDVNIMGPSDIAKENGLTGGHIFQGEILPNYLWENRLSASTPMQGFYMCGACTHPGGSVIGINGRNAAFQLFADLSVSPKARSRL